MPQVSRIAEINPHILRWAREGLSIPIEKAASVAHVDKERYRKWENGEEYPTFPMLRSLANLYKRPLPVFFMSFVPKDTEYPKDYRLNPAAEAIGLSKKAKLGIRKAIWFQIVAKELLEALDQEFTTIDLPKISANESIEDITGRIRDIKKDIQFGFKKNRIALNFWREYLEQKGIFVFQISMPKEEIRGFSLLKSNHPAVIVINSQDTVNGRIFTLFHEYGHILLNQSGICNPNIIELRNDRTNEMELFCNKLPGNFLVPTDMLKSLLAQQTFSDINEKLNSLSKKFSVSTFVILRRLYDLHLVEYAEYINVYAELKERIKKTSQHGGDKDSKYRNIIAEEGRKLLKLVNEAQYGGKIPMSKALDIIGRKLQLREYNTLMEYLY